MVTVAEQGAGYTQGRVLELARGLEAINDPEELERHIRAISNPLSTGQFELELEVVCYQAIKQFADNPDSAGCFTCSSDC